ncbi:PIN/TRAM domain-containing protein [Atopobacter sp. AH10]|uniref:PIN/TRAM domain-containing protein n=1 Tax=Atopobacter sp. AH10 TaxID=2315861 RepID=UPI000EF23D5C|nr:PIN/TRAM domain-containing protein [Atopobacter sp. AH10]RLK62808.1 PIN/TRAM domain-containing protein [Atopobacter sp. AH10]
MRKRLIRIIFLLIGGSLGGSYLPAFWQTVGFSQLPFNHIVINILIGALIFYLLSFVCMNFILELLDRADAYIEKVSIANLILGITGIVIGLLLATLISFAITAFRLPIVSQVVPPILAVGFSYLGYKSTTTRMNDILALLQYSRKKAHKEAKDAEKHDALILSKEKKQALIGPKILDTSVIIDGRVQDILKTGFLEGTILIPNFVLKELQLIADSSDSLKRSKGRRGLDILNDLQKLEDVDVEMWEGDYENVPEVDSKLIHLAKELDGTVVTNDFNLNKVSEFQGVSVLNINALANAVKPIVIPGEKMNVTVVKSGTERRQGVAYLADGTMIVVEDGQGHIGENVDVEVTSSLQTAAGRMIFAKLEGK